MRRFALAFGILLIASAAHAEGPLESLDCLARAAYFEARGEGYEGMLAVAFVGINRAYDRDTTPCAVIYADDWNYPGFESVLKGPIRDESAWTDAQRAAIKAWTDPGADPTFGSTDFHALRVHPHWVGKVEMVQIGNHVFFRSATEIGASNGK